MTTHRTKTEEEKEERERDLADYLEQLGPQLRFPGANVSFDFRRGWEYARGIHKCQ